MKRAFLIASCFSMVLGFAAAPAALAGDRGVKDVPVRTVRTVSNDAPQFPVVNTFEEGDQKLKIVALPASNGIDVDLTLIYEYQNTVRTASINPKLVATADAAVLTGFLAEIDPSFISFVRASIADQFLHQSDDPSASNRAISAVFFPSQNAEPNEFVGIQAE